MTTLNLGALKFNWKGVYSGATAYVVNDCVSFGGNSYVCIVANAGQVTTNLTYWNVLTQGLTVMTTTGDIIYQDTGGPTRLPVGSGGQVLVIASGKPAWQTPSGYSGVEPFTPAYGLVADPANASAWLRTPWLISAANNYYADCALPSPACGPVKRSQTRQHIGFRHMAWLNANKEFIIRGEDNSLHFAGTDGTGPANGSRMVMNMSSKFGGMRTGDYFVQIHSTWNGWIALTAQGDLFSIGLNAQGVLGTGDTVDKYVWTKIPYLGPDSSYNSLPCTIMGLHVGNNGQHDASDSSMFQKTVHAIDTSGRLWAWGLNAYGQLGLGNTVTPVTVPTLVTSVSNIRQISGSGYHTAIVDSSGQLYTCGFNTGGPLGNGTTTDSSLFAAVSGMTNVYQVEAMRLTYYSGGWAVAGGATFALKNNGTLWACGTNNTDGYLGHGGTAQVSAFTAVGGATTFSSIYVSHNYIGPAVYALGGTPGASNKTIYSWGKNTGSECGVGNQGTVLAPAQPLSTTQYSNSLSSAVNGAVTNVAAAYPRTDISVVMPVFSRGESTGAGCFSIDATTKNLWFFGYNNGLDIVDNLSAASGTTNATPQKFPSPWNTNDAWAGSNSADLVDFCGGGYAYNAEGSNVIQVSDGRMFAIGDNSYKKFTDDALYSAQWRRVTA
jgi:alpha-tubulin suppressor-like RCC1 family protein